MKTLTVARQISLCETSAEQVASAVQLLGSTFAADMAWIDLGLAQGFYQSTTICVDNVARFVVVWHVNQQRVLFVNAAAALTPEFADFTALLEGVKYIAGQNGCRAIEAMTLRAGLLKKLLADGFKTIGVTVQFKISDD